MAKIFHCEKSESPILTHDMADKQRKLVANMPDGSPCAKRTSPVIQLGSLTHLLLCHKATRSQAVYPGSIDKSLDD